MLFNSSGVSQSVKRFAMALRCLLMSSEHQVLTRVESCFSLEYMFS